MTSVGCNVRRVQLRLQSRSILAMSVPPKRRVARQSSRVLSHLVCLLQTNKTNRRKEKRLPWLQQQAGQIPGQKLATLKKQPNNRQLALSQARRLRRHRRSHSRQRRNRLQRAANRQPLRNLPPRRRRTPCPPPTLRVISRLRLKQVRQRNRLSWCLPKCPFSALRTSRAKDCGLSLDYC